MMREQIYKRLSEGLWTTNAALVQLLGLCPLLAVSNSFVNALGLGIATIFVLIASNSLISLLRKHIPDLVRIPCFIIIIASFTTAAELLTQAFAFPLYESIGIFIPLIVTNCAILGRAESYASKQGVAISALDGLMMGLGFALVLVLLGSIREILGNGTLFSGMTALLSSFDFHGVDPTLRFIPSQSSGILLFLFPTGAFILTGLLIALKNTIDDYRSKRLNCRPNIIGSDRAVDNKKLIR